MNNNQPGCIFKQRIETPHINIPYFTITIFTHIFGQEERSRITLLTGNEFCNLFYFRRIDKGTLYTYRISSLQEEHISLTNQTVSTRTVKNSTRVHHGRYTESDTRREVGFNRTRNDIGSRTLCSNNHVNTDSTCQLRNTGNRKFHFLTGSHNQISELVNNHYDIRHKLMPLFRIQTTVDKLLIIFSYITYMRHLQQVITGIHLYTNRVQGLHNLRYVCNNRFASIRKFGQEMIFNHRIDAEFYFLRVDQYKFQFCRMLLI